MYCLSARWNQLYVSQLRFPGLFCLIDHKDVTATMAVWPHLAPWEVSPLHLDLIIRIDIVNQGHHHFKIVEYFSNFKSFKIFKSLLLWRWQKKLRTSSLPSSMGSSRALFNVYLSITLKILSFGYALCLHYNLIYIFKKGRLVFCSALAGFYKSWLVRPAPPVSIYFWWRLSL